MKPTSTKIARDGYAQSWKAKNVGQYTPVDKYLTLNPFLVRVFLISVLFLLFTGSKSLSQPLKIDSSAMEVAKSMQRDAVAKGDSFLLAKAFYQFGRAYAFSGNNFLAKRYYIKSVRLLETFPDSYELGLLYVRICEYTNMNANSSEDINTLNKAIAIFKKVKSPQGLAMAYGMLQGAYSWRWFVDLAGNSDHFNQLLKLTEMELQSAAEAKDSTFIVDAYVRKGDTYRLLHRYQEALDNQKKALAVANASRNDTIRIRAMLSLCDTYIDKGNLDSADFYLTNVENIYKNKKYEHFFILRHILESKTSYYRRAGNWKRALETSERINNIMAVTEMVDFDKATTVVQQEADAEKNKLFLLAKEKEIDLNRQLLSSQRTFILVAIAFLLLFAILCFLLYRLYRKYQQASFKNEQLVIEQNHRVKNNLQILSSILNMQARVMSDPEARKAISNSRLRVLAMAAIQKKLYDNDTNRGISLSEFVPDIAQTALEACGLEKVQQHYSIEDVAIDTDKTVSVGLIITELVINACKYAFNENPDPLLSIELRRQAKSIELIVRDNGAEQLSAENPTNSISNSNANGQFGKNLIALLVAQLDGTSSYSFENGTVFRMRFQE